MKEIVILAAARTPIGKFGGRFTGVGAVELGTIALGHPIAAILIFMRFLNLNRLK